MKIPATPLRIAPYVGLIVLAFLLFRQCERTAAKNQEQESTQAFLNDTISYYENEIGQVVADKTTIQGSAEALKVLLSKQIDSTQQLKRLVDKFKKVKVAGNITTVTKFDTVYLPYSDVVTSVPFQRAFNRNTEYYSISGTVNESGIKFNAPEIYNTLSFAIGEKKTGFLKSEYRIEAVNSNPFVKTTGLDSYTLEVPRKRLGLSLYVGYGLSDNFVFKPSAGIALTYNLIRF